MADAFDDWYKHKVDVATIGDPDEWGATTTTKYSNVPCWVEDKTEMVRNGAGEEEVSTSILHVALADGAKFKPGSIVTRGGHDSRVIAVEVADSTTGDELDGARVRLA